VPRRIWYFDFVSPFAYLQFAAHPGIFQRSDVDMKPVLLAGLLKHFEHKGPAEIEPKRIHTYRYTQWQAEKYGIPMKYPPGHPFNSLHALRLAMALGSTYDTVKAIFDFIWVEGRSPTDEFKVLCDALGVPGAEVLAAGESVKHGLRENTDAAIRAGVFGVPTFVVDDNLFWGVDATPMLLDYLDNPRLFESDEMKRLRYLPIAAARRT
jgi:2-hydroxychromene-2-carboxylate isomerase